MYSIVRRSCQRVRPLRNDLDVPCDLNRAARRAVVVQSKWTHTFKGAAPETGGPGSTYSQPAKQVHDDRCEEGAECIIVAYFHGKRDFMPVNMKAK
jgi:hypothetical protein